MKTIRRYGNLAEAGFARSLLEAAGIDASLADEYAATLGFQYAPWGIRLQVPEDDEQRSLEILDGQGGLDSHPPGVTLDEAVPMEHEVNSLVPAVVRNNDTRKIRIKRIKAGSLFSLIFVAIFSVFVPLILFCGVLALFGFRTVFENSYPVFGLKGLLTALVMAPFFSLIFSVIIWICMYLGIRIWGGSITIEYVPANDP